MSVSTFAVRHAHIIAFLTMYLSKMTLNQLTIVILEKNKLI